MEQALLKLARQLDSLDEASLMALWEKYAQIVNNFEPSQRWQDAVLVFSLIQAKHWKNQLFNSCWANRMRAPRQRGAGMSEPSGMPFSLDMEKEKEPPRRATVISFEPEKKPED